MSGVLEYSSHPTRMAYEKKGMFYGSDRLEYEYAVDSTAGAPALAANSTPQAPYRSFQGNHHPNHHNDSNDSLFHAMTGEDGSQSPVDLSPPATPIPLHEKAPFSSSAFVASKRSLTTSVMPSSTSNKDEHAHFRSEPLARKDTLENDDDGTHSNDNNEEDDMRLKRHSTYQSSIMTNESKEAAAVVSGRPLARHHTTGHALRQKKKQHEITGISEEFAKELSARRRAFKRLSRRQDDLNVDEDQVLMGTRVDKHHRNYVLMYNMLTGIRIAVGRVSAKPDREVQQDDFAAAHKLAFSVTGDELTPGAKYDFKFKDYAPWVFRNLREKFGIDPADYLVSLTSKYILSELGSPGKSGSFFYYSRDYRFIIKTIHHNEHKLLRRILHEYYAHVSNNPDTLLCRYYGLHRVKLPHGRKIHFVVMGNVFPPNKDIHETYDLKGSLVGRLLNEEAAKKPNAVMKDLNFVQNKKKLQLGPQKRRMFVSQLVRDVKLLVRLNIMDYSLLIGIHNMMRGNKDNIRDSTLQLFRPDTKRAERRASVMKRRQSKAQAMRKAIAQTNPERLDASELPKDTFDERRNCVFYSDDGGFQSTDENDRGTNSLYYMGIIDILTPYDAKKKSEHFFKSMTQDKRNISAVKPVHYGDRFMDFMAKAVEHNEDIPRDFQMSQEGYK